MRTGRRGRSPHYSDLAIETGVMPRLAFGRPWRQTEGLLRSVATLPGVGIDVPDHTTLSRRSAALSLDATLTQTKGPVTVVIDSTRLKVFGAGEWQIAKRGGRDRRTWRKLHLGIAPDCGEILASALTGTEDGDPTYRAVAERAPGAARPAYRDDHRHGPVGMAEGRRLWPAIPRRDRHAALQAEHRTASSRPHSIGTKG